MMAVDGLGDYHCSIWWVSAKIGVGVSTRICYPNKYFIQLHKKKESNDNNSTLRYECDETFSDECEFAARVEAE